MRPDGVGAVLMQQGQPIAYFSKALSTKTMSTSAYDRELMALALAIEYWQPYLRSLLYESTNAAFAIFLSNRLLLWLSNVIFLNCWATDLWLNIKLDTPIGLLIHFRVKVTLNWMLSLTHAGLIWMNYMLLFIMIWICNPFLHPSNRIHTHLFYKEGWLFQKSLDGYLN